MEKQHQEFEITQVLKMFDEQNETKILQNVENVFVCEECNHKIFGEEDGYIFCAACGVTRSNNILNHDIEFTQSSCGRRMHDRCGQSINPLLPHAGLSTIIIGGDERIKQLQIWGSSNHKDQAKLRMLSVIYAKSAKANLNLAIMREVEALAVEVCDRMTDLDFIYRGKLRLGLIAACFFFAFKKTGNARNCDELADLLEVEVAVVIRGVKLYSDLFQHKQLIFDDQRVDSLEFLPRFCNRLHIPKELEEMIGRVCKEASSKNLLMKHAIGARIATCIFFVIKAANMEHIIARQEISTVCNVSEVTIVKCLKELQLNVAIHTTTS